MTYTEIQPDIWKPINVGDSVEGVLLGLDESVGRNNSKIYSLETSDGKRYKIWGSAILDDRLKYCKIGDKIKIVYEGSTVNKIGQPLKIYKVFRDVPNGVTYEKVL